MKSAWIIAIICLVLSMSVQAEEGDEASLAADEELNSEDGGTDKKDVARQGHLDLDKSGQAALVSELKTHEVVWLDVEYPAPEGSSQGSSTAQVLALQQAAHKAQQHGAVLLLPGKEQHADWPELISPMRKTLPEAGWYTLSVSLPAYSEGEIPKRQLPAKKIDSVILNDALRQALTKPASRQSKEETDNTKVEAAVEDTDVAEEPATINEDESNDKPVDIDLGEKDENIKAVPYEDKAMVHLEAGMRHLQQQGYQNIVLLAYRSSANLALGYIEKIRGQIADKGFALVMIDPVLDENYQFDIAKALGKSFPAPVLELVDFNDLDQQMLAKQRIRSARVAGIARYMQVEQSLKKGEGIQKSLIRRVRYWLERHAPGMVKQGR